MHISRIEIQNFRNFKQLELTVGRNAVLIGPNRVGKSNLLYALRLVLDSSLPDSQRHLRAEDFWGGLSQPFHGNVISIAVDISDFDNNVDAKALLADALVNTNPAVARITYQFRPKSKIIPSQAGEDDYTFIIYGGTNQTRWVSPDLRRLISLMLLPALRDVESDLQSWRRSPLRPLLERLRLDDKHVTSILRDLNKATEELLDEVSFKELSSELSDRLEEMVGDHQSTDTRLGFASTRQEQLLRTVRLFVDGDKSRPINDASLGTANVLYLVLLLQDLENRRKQKDTVSTIIAIEEPEAHLHPHVQRLVFRYFLKQEAQVIVSTHSAHIVRVTPLDAMAMLKSHPKDGTRAYTIHKLSLSDADKVDLERYLDVTRAEILFARGVIFVEGTAEQFLIPVFAATLGIDLDRLGITICSVSGTDFRPYFRLLSKEGFDIPCAVVTDGDQTEKDGAIDYLGLKRGVRLLPDSPLRNQIQGYIDDGNWNKARQSLAQIGIFVGDNTLEIDCLSTLDNAMVKTYDDLGPSNRQKQKFVGLIATSKSGNRKAASDLITHIEGIGKGRFAQRLAANISNERAPSYIEAAIKWISSQVE